MDRSPRLQKQSRLQHLASLSWILADEPRANQNLQYSVQAHQQHQQPSESQSLAIRGRALTIEDVEGTKAN